MKPYWKNGRSQSSTVFKIGFRSRFLCEDVAASKSLLNAEWILNKVFPTKGIRLHVLRVSSMVILFLGIDAGGIPTSEDSSVEVLNFPNAPLTQMIEVYARLTGRTAIYASNLQGRIVLQGNGPLTHDDAILALENVFTANGFSIIKQGDRFFKVVPSDRAKQEGIRVQTGDEPLIAADQLVSRIFPLKFVEATTMQSSLEPMRHAFGQITSFPRTNTLLITDTGANLMEMAKLIDFMDRPLEAKVKTKFYILKNAKAKDVVARILELLNSTMRGQSVTKSPSGSGASEELHPPSAPSGLSELTFNEEAVVSGKVTLTADERTNQVILLTRAANLPFFDQIVEKLDADTAAPMLLRSISLKYAEANALSGLLNQILGHGGGNREIASKKERLRENSDNPYNVNKHYASVQSPMPGPLVGKNGIRGIQSNELGVYADTRTNALIVSGTVHDIQWVERFVKDVDVLLAQVLLEGVIVEVSLNREDHFGVQVLARASDGQLSQAALTHTLPTHLLDASTIAASAVPAGLPLGLNYFATLRSSKVDALVQALANNSNVKILSQPVIQTSHNEEAKIVVAEARPIVTSTSVSTIAGGAPQVSNFEYKDIGIQLTIKPLINPDGLVTLDILQRVDNINGFQAIDNNQVPIIARREANSVVSVQDGEMVILGGLVENRETLTKSGVPFLSDLPLLGYFFGTTNKKRVRTELMVLLKPTVLRIPEAASEEAMRRRSALELFKRRSVDDILLNKKNLLEQIDSIERPTSVPATEVELPQPYKENF